MWCAVCGVRKVVCKVVCGGGSGCAGKQVDDGKVRHLCTNLCMFITGDTSYLRTYSRQCNGGINGCVLVWGRKEARGCVKSLHVRSVVGAMEGRWLVGRMNVDLNLTCSPSIIICARPKLQSTHAPHMKLWARQQWHWKQWEWCDELMGVMLDGIGWKGCAERGKTHSHIHASGRSRVSKSFRNDYIQTPRTTKLSC